MAVGKLPDHYAALGVPQDASPATIRSSYKKLMLQCHPDKVHDETQRAEKAAMFEKVQQAYEILSDSRKRRKYDEELSKGGSRARASTNSGNPPGKEESSGARDRDREERRERSDQKGEERRRRHEERRSKHTENYYEEPHMPPPPPRRSHTTGHRSYPPDEPAPKLHRSSTSARYASASHSDHPQSTSPPRPTYGSSTHRYPDPEPSPRKKDRESSSRHRSYEHPSPNQATAESTASYAGTESSRVRMGYEERLAAEKDRKAKAAEKMGLRRPAQEELSQAGFILDETNPEPNKAPVQRKESHGSAGTARPHFPPGAMPAYVPHSIPHPHPSPAATYTAGYYPGYPQEPPEMRYQRGPEELRHMEEKRRKKEEREKEKQAKAKERLSELAGSAVGSDMPSPRERKPSVASSHKPPGYTSHHRRRSSITHDFSPREFPAAGAYIPSRAPLGGGAGMSSSASAVGGIFGGGPTGGSHVFGSLPTGAPLGTTGRPRRHSDVGSPTPEKMHASARMPPPAPPRESAPPAQTDSGYSSPSSPQNKDSSTTPPPAKSLSTSPNLSFPKKPVPSTPNPNPSPSGLAAAAAAAATPQPDGSGASWKRYTFEVYVREDGTTTTPGPLPLPRRKTSSSHSTIDDAHDLSSLPPELIPHVLGNKEYLMRPVPSSPHATPIPGLANLHLDSASYASPPPSQHGDLPRSSYGGSGGHTSAHSSPRMHPAMHRHHTGSTAGSSYHPSPKMEPKGFSPSLPRSSTFHAPPQTSAPLGSAADGKGPSSRRTPATKSFTPPGLAASHTFS